MPSSAGWVRSLHSHQYFELLPTNSSAALLLSRKWMITTFKQNIRPAPNHAAAGMLLSHVFASVQRADPRWVKQGSDLQQGRGRAGDSASQELHAFPRPLKRVMSVETECNWCWKCMRTNKLISQQTRSTGFMGMQYSPFGKQIWSTDDLGG